MPLYEYLCEDCGHAFERLVPVGAPESPPCPQCKGTRARRLLSVIAGLGGTSGAPEAGAAQGCACGGACSCR